MGAWGTGVLDAQRLATYIELVATIRLLLFAGEATRELTAVVSEQFDDLHGCSLLQTVQEVHATIRALIAIDVDKHPARGAVDSHALAYGINNVRHLRT